MGPSGPMMTRTWQRIALGRLNEQGMRDQALDRYPNGLPWKVVLRLLDDHGVPERVYRDEGPANGLPPWGSSTVPTEAFFDFLGY